MANKITSGDILSPEQLHTHLRIFAGPGAGKTHFLVENVKNIVTNYPPVSNSYMRKVLCVTYTNAAVDEIKRRLERFSDSVEVSTIHGFIIEHIIKPFQKDLRDIIKEEFSIDVGNKKPLTSQIKGVGILHGFDKPDIYKFINSTIGEDAEIAYSKKAMASIEVDIKNYLEHCDDDNFEVRLTEPPAIDPKHIKPIKRFIWSKARKLTHDEILYFGYRILERNSTALYTIRVKFPFVFVDEFQDTNPIQTKLLKLLGKKSTIVGVIGDVAQSIYSFQGAKPSHFQELTIDGNTELVDYVIKGNRRSTANIVEFCNFIRKSDSSVTQTSIRPYANDTDRMTAESKPVHFLIGDSDSIKNIIKKVIVDGGVVLTRSWSKAFSYVYGIGNEQVKLLKNIYNHYYTSTINIRDEIAEIGSVKWVKAFNFIFLFYKAYTNSSFIDAYNAFKLYVNIDNKNFNLKILRLIKAIADEVFEGLTDTLKTVSVIEKFNTKIKDTKYALLCDSLLGGNFNMPFFDEYDLTSQDSKRFIDSLNQLNWITSYKLFTEVFSKDSRYMTVHEAKGLEWDKVIVSVEPIRDEKKVTNLQRVYSDPQILQETVADEFVRIYYVACSRAREDLYIHLPEEFDTSLIANIFQNESSYEILQ